MYIDKIYNRDIISPLNFETQNSVDTHFSYNQLYNTFNIIFKVWLKIKKVKILLF